jgi:hypothetical protein
MLIDICNDITRLTDNEDVNTQNYLESLSYINNLYDVLNELKLVVSMNNLVFLPTFKGYYICEQLGIDCTDKESEMKFFKIKSSLFLEDEQIKHNIKEKFLDSSEKVFFKDDTLTIILK